MSSMVVPNEQPVDGNANSLYERERKKEQNRLYRQYVKKEEFCPERFCPYEQFGAVAPSNNTGRSRSPGSVSTTPSNGSTNTSANAPSNTVSSPSLSEDRFKWIVGGGLLLLFIVALVFLILRLQKGPKIQRV